ncbi:MAG: Uma2 family endonuclease [Capsulimonas sp.]|uniref:Uma2 family endonuclease n=1 Tax=Capsulimonas sp. TaxID=2494211 RepID=UPI0032635797
MSSLTISPDKYLATERASDLRSEYISGEVVTMAGASNRHETIVINLAGQLSNKLRRTSCRPLGGGLRIRIREANYLYADLTVICGAIKLVDDGYDDTLLNPTVIFEILSKTTEDRDHGVKWRLYQQIPSLEHYVIVDQITACVEIYTRHADVDWLVHTETGLEGQFTLSAIGVTLSLADLYEDVALEPDPLTS